MSNELTTEVSAEIINSLILTGDLSGLKPAQQTQYYIAVCKSIDINPLTQPFAIITYNGKKVLYATKGCTQQLAGSRMINTEVKNRETKDTVYIVSVRATDNKGRFTDEDGVVSIVGLKGIELANAMMKATTKAKRRSVLALCGLGMPDESEIEDIKTEPTVDTSKSKVEKIVNQVEEAEIVKQEPVPEPAHTTEPKPKAKAKDEKKEAPKSDPVVSEPVLSEGHHKIQTVIDSWKCLEIGDDKKPKWVFVSGEIKLGTFDSILAEEICKVLDVQAKNRKGVLVNIEYKERETKPGVFVKDIVSFSQVTINEVLI